MEVSDKELRKMLNAAWDKAHFRHFVMPYPLSKGESSRRYRDVTKIIKEAKARKEQP